MSPRFLHVYFMGGQPNQVMDAAPKHAAYWHDLDLPGYLGGPFADRSGGCISFLADTEAEAEALVAGDPFVVADLLSERWLKAWQAE